MTVRVAVIGAGMGGLTASIRLAQLGYEVSVFEARAGCGGLASGRTIGGLQFDAGPYILLDRPGLEWAFRQLGVPMEAVELRRLDPVYEVRFPDTEPLVFYANGERTAEEMERRWTGSGSQYLSLVRNSESIYRRLQPLQRISRPRLHHLLTRGAWRDVRFLSRSLQSVLKSTGLPSRIIDGIGIWTHIAGQPLAEAPSPLGLVPALMHSIGAYYPRGGIGKLPERLYRRAESVGVQFHFETKVASGRFESTPAGRPVAVLQIEGENERFDAVVSNYSGVGTYLDLFDVVDPRRRQRLGAIPLQSPGVCAYLRVSGVAPKNYLSFRLGGDHPCRLLIQPSAVDPGVVEDGGAPVRILSSHAGTAPEQYLDALVKEPWWEESNATVEVLDTRTPATWGRDFHLYRNSMNPVMTARLMRSGRLAHRSPFQAGLYLTGSSTHPGQWVSFCAISGILAADALHQDYA